MIMKKRTKPLKILILSALLRRLPKNHVKRALIASELSRREAGYQGEESLDIEIVRLFDKNNMIFHDLNFNEGDTSYQIDNLVISPARALIIEVKNMTNQLIFDTENDQFYLKNGDTLKGYTDPVSQVQRHQAYIKKLLAENNFPPLPVDYLIVVNNPNAILVFKGTPHEIRKRICKSHSFNKRAQQIEELYTDEILTSKELRKLSRLLLKKNTPPTNYILKKFEIKKSELLTGVCCPSGDHLPMTRKKRKWYCPTCHTYSTDAHIELLQDYFLLFDTKITNKQFRSFAQIDSIDVSKRLLLSINLNRLGKNKTRAYAPNSIPL
ncbi:MAG: hypothetical protein K0Q87_3130 [Neobacillus sp.]|nr:hypothetical protein [Neobacillus sp.]